MYYLATAMDRCTHPGYVPGEISPMGSTTKVINGGYPTVLLPTNWVQHIKPGKHPVIHPPNPGQTGTKVLIEGVPALGLPTNLGCGAFSITIVSTKILAAG